MYRISKWKLGLIIAIFVFSGLYLLPTIPGLYGRFFGYFSVWMQSKIPSPDVQSSADGEFIRFAIPEELPVGTSVEEAAISIKDLVGRRLSKLGIKDEAEEAQRPAVGGEFGFDDIVITDLYVVFSQPKSKAELEEIVSKLDLSGDPPLVSLPPELPSGEREGTIKFAVTRADVPQGKTMRDVSKDLQDKLREQLIAQKMTTADFNFDAATRNELHVRFNPQKSRTELNTLIEKLELYGALPIALRPIFPANTLKQGLDLKGGFHVVQELDVEKAMDMYLDTQAKDVIFSSLRGEDILCRQDTGVLKTLEKRGNNVFVVRPYVSEDSEISQADAVANMKRKLTALGFSSVSETSTENTGPELTARMDVEWEIGELVKSVLGGENNPLIVTIPFRQNVERDEYLKTAEETLDKLELFDEPVRLRVESNEMREKVAVYSVQLSEDSATKLAEQNIDMVMKTLESRINKFGVAESTIRRVPRKRQILIEVPEERNPTRTLKAVTEPAILTFKMVEPDPDSGTGKWMGCPGMQKPNPDELPIGTEVRDHREGGWRVVSSEAFMGGHHLRSNSAMVRHGDMGAPEVIMFLNSDGQREFSRVTSQHVGEFTAILLDDVIQTDPLIKEKINTSSARITGDFTEEEADYLAKVLKAGSFPAPMKIVEKRVVGPTLGQSAINIGKLSFVVGIILVVGFMMIYYKVSGLIAVIALLFAFQIILAFLAGLGATLTLPGMAGLVLTIGMSVDANVLIFERIRDELRSGKTVLSSIDTGYQRAFWAILDSNVTTILSALVLYEFGTGPIKGFAVTLTIGIAASMFTALIVTREMYRWIYHKRTPTKLSI